MEITKTIENFETCLNVWGRSKNTIKAYMGDLNKFVNYNNYNQNNDISQLEDLRKEDIYDFVGSLTKQNGSSIDNHSKTRIIASLKTYFNYLNDNNIVKNNPTIGLKKPTGRKRVIKYLTEEEMIKLMKSLEKNKGQHIKRDRLILLFFLNLGLRESELVNIDISHIKNGILLILGKGNKEREIPLPENCLTAMEEYINTRNKSCGDALFVSERNTRLTAQAIIKIVKKYLMNINRQDLSPHKLRHSCLTNLVKNGVDLNTVKEIAGHADIRTTTIYLHTDNSMKRSAINTTALSRI